MFCFLIDEFIVFIVNIFLFFLVNDIVRVCIGMVFVSLMIIVYIWYFYGKKKMKIDWDFVLCLLIFYDLKRNMYWRFYF